MLSTGPKRKFIYAASEYIYLIAGAASSFILWVMDLEGDEKWLEQRTFLLIVIHKIQEYGIYGLGFFACLVLICVLVKQRADPWVVEKLQFILDEYQAKVFRNANAPQDHNRVTLFKFRKCLWYRRHWREPRRWAVFKTRRVLGDYLVPYMRSGHMTLKTKTVFFIDSENSNRSEGVAGRAWSHRGVVVLPDLPLITPTAGARTRENYAKVTQVSQRFLDRYLSEQRGLPRSMAAIPVECNGKLWGVIVLDSLDPLSVTAESVEHYTLTVALIGHLLERA